MNSIYGWVKVAKVPGGYADYSMATANAAGGRLTVLSLEDGSWMASHTDSNWYTCSVFDEGGHEIAHFINPNAPKFQRKPHKVAA